MMSNAVWKGIFLVVVLFVGDPFFNLKAQTVDVTPVTHCELAHNTPKT
jgi:hypothetical protein